MKVLHVVDGLRLGGAENLLATLGRADPAVGLRVSVASLAPPEGTDALLPVLLEAGLEVRFLSVPRLSSPRAVPAVWSAIRDSGADVVHAHLEYAATLTPPAAALARRPAVCTFHHVAGPLTPREAAKERLAVATAGRSRAVVFVSEASRASFARRYRSRSTWEVLPNGVDLGDFRPEPSTFPAALGLPPDVPVVTVVAALRAAKGQAVALQAWPSVLRHVPEARLLLVGSGPEEGSLRREVARLGLAGHVVLAGSRTDVPRLLRASTLALLPSDTEALPTALVEAAACGRAAVATDVGGVPEVVQHGRTGLLVPPRDPPALADAVSLLLSDPQQRAEMGRRARRLAEERFDVLAWGQALVRLYERAAGRVPVGG